MTEYVPCPEPGCDLPAAVLDRWTADGSPMPVSMIKVRCARLHWAHAAEDTMQRGGLA